MKLSSRIYKISNRAFSESKALQLLVCIFGRWISGILQQSIIIVGMEATSTLSASENFTVGGGQQEILDGTSFWIHAFLFFNRVTFEKS